MEKIVKVPDRKLRSGAILGIIVSSCAILWSLILVVVIFALPNLLNKTDAAALDEIAMKVTKIIISVISTIVIVVAGLIIWWCINILKNKTNSSLAAGIVMIVIALLGISMFAYNMVAIVSISLVLSIVQFIAGILLIVGKYETVDPKDLTKRKSKSAKIIPETADN